MEQGALFHESLGEALGALVAALGGKKVVASILWPEKPADEGARYLADCLNPDRAANLSPEKLLLLLRLGREKSVHFAMAWITDAVGYAPPQPVEPEDQRAQLQREAIATVAKLDGLVTRLERLGSGPSLRTVRA